MKLLQSACPLDCPDACSLTVSVEDGKVVTLDGNEANSVTRGYICAKVRRFPQAMYGKERLLNPAIRAGDKGDAVFHDASWDEALDLVTRKLVSAKGDHGAESILPFSYGGSNGLLSQDTTDARLFRRLGASNLARTVCAAATGRAAEGLYGKMPGVGYPDYVHANLIVIWGANPEASGIHLLPYVKEARERGSKVVVVDPRRTRLAGRAELHLAPRPGTDLPLALSIIRWLFAHGGADEVFFSRHVSGADELRAKADEWTIDRAADVCEVSPKDIETFARLYAESSPAVIRCGWGLERNRNGGSAVAAVLALPAVAGKFGIQGGGYTLSNKAAWNLEGAKGAKADPPRTRTINMNKLGEVLTADTDPPIKFLFVYNSNPLTTIPNQSKVRAGLRREDLFTVVFDSFMTDTAAYADVVLPATTFLERREILTGYGAYVLQDASPVVERVGESRTNHEVFLELCRRLDVSRPGDPNTESEVAAAIFSGERGQKLQLGLDEHWLAHPEFGEAPVQFVDVLPRTADKRVHLFPSELNEEAPDGLYTYQTDAATREYPLVLISPSSNRTISSMLGQLDTRQIPLGMHPDDARVRGVENGDSVRVWNDLGEVRCRVRVSTTTQPGVVELPKGIWAHNTLSGTTANALAPDMLTDLGAGACFNDARVQVESAGLTE